MSTTSRVCQVIKSAIQRSPAFADFDHDSIYIGGVEPGVLSAISIDGTYSIEGKSRQRGATLHLWMPTPDQATGGDIEDMADGLIASLRRTAIEPSTWIRQPDPTSGVDHVVFPVIVYLDLLPSSQAPD